MIKHQAVSEQEEEKLEQRSGAQGSKKADLGNEFDSLEEELNNFSITINGDLKPKIGSLYAQPPPMQSPGFARDPSEHF